jgi:hypothetical protein
VSAVAVILDDGHCVETTGRYLLERPQHLVVHSSAEQLPLLELMLRAVDSVEDTRLQLLY